MESGRPWTLGTSGSTIPQHCVELCLGHGEAIRSKAAWTAGYRRPWSCPDVMRGVVSHLAMNPCWFCQLREFLQEAV